MPKRIQSHERLTDEEAVARSSERGFGAVLVALFVVIGLLPLLGGRPPRGWALAVAGVVLAVTLVKAEALAPFNTVWFRLGLLLHRLVSPVILAMIYFAVVTPTGLIMRALGKDPLRLRRDPDAESYWIHRDPPGPDRESMSNQF